MNLLDDVVELIHTDPAVKAMPERHKELRLEAPFDSIPSMTRQLCEGVLFDEGGNLIRSELERFRANPNVFGIVLDNVNKDRCWIAFEKGRVYFSMPSKT